jgi:pyruvate carboxylase
VDVALGAGVRSYGQGDILATAAYIEDELGLPVAIDREMVREANFVLKQIMPYYDRYVAPYFQGIDYDVTLHGMPGGATSASQEGAMQQGYIHLLPYMLKFLAGTRQIVRYHDVTPGSQITWNTAFLAVTGAYKRGGEDEVRHLLGVLERVNSMSEAKLGNDGKKERLMLYQDCNDAFRSLLLGKFGRLPLGFPPDWVYQSAFGGEWSQAVKSRTEVSPLEFLKDIDFDAEEIACETILKRKPNDEEFIMYLNHPGDAVKTIQFNTTYGDPNHLPLDVWFEGMQPGQELNFTDSNEKPHTMQLLSISPPDSAGVAVVRYVLDSENMSHQVQVTGAANVSAKGIPMADTNDPYQVASPSNGDLWVMYVHVGDVVEKGDELFNISIMKQEKAVLAPVRGSVKRILKTANYKETRKMAPVRGGELIIELGPVPRVCPNKACGRYLPLDGIEFCPYCGKRMAGE